MKEADSTESSAEEISTFLVSVGGSGAFAFGLLPEEAAVAGGGDAARASCALEARPSIALRGSARAPARRRRVTAGVGKAGGQGGPPAFPGPERGWPHVRSPPGPRERRAGPPPGALPPAGPALCPRAPRPRLVAGSPRPRGFDLGGTGWRLSGRE